MEMTVEVKQLLEPLDVFSVQRRSVLVTSCIKTLNLLESEIQKDKKEV